MICFYLDLSLIFYKKSIDLINYDPLGKCLDRKFLSVRPICEVEAPGNFYPNFSIYL